MKKLKVIWFYVLNLVKRNIIEKKKFYSKRRYCILFIKFVGFMNNIEN